MPASYQIQDRREKDFLLAGTMLALSIMAHVVFMAESGRYVPTGSVLGFQGVSYFYVTGLIGYLVSCALAVSGIRKWKSVTVGVEGPVVTFLERGIRSRGEYSLQQEEIILIHANGGVSRGSLFSWVSGFGWAAFLFQLAVPNLMTGGIGFLAGSVLLLFTIALLVAIIINVLHARGDLLVFTSTGTLRIKLGRPLGRGASQARDSVLQSFLASLDLSVVPAQPLPQAGKIRRLFTTIPACMMAWCSGNLLLLVTGNPWGFFNQAVIWLIAWAATVAILYPQFALPFPRVMGVYAGGVKNLETSQAFAGFLRIPALLLLGAMGVSTGVLCSGIPTFSAWAWLKFFLSGTLVLLGGLWAATLARWQGTAISIDLSEHAKLRLTPFYVKVCHQKTGKNSQRFIASIHRAWNAPPQMLLSTIFLLGILIGLAIGI